MPSRARILAACLAAVALLGAGALLFSPLRVWWDDPADGAPVRGVSTVDAAGREFSPPVIEVPAGTTVTWRFADVDDGEPVAHNVTGEGWRSPDRLTGVYKRRFDRAGEFRYRCDLHFRMRGRVDVVAR